jgi:iron complex transport system permease protein
VLGAALMLLGDVFGRVAVRPGELPAGVALSVIGTPIFIALVRRRRIASL